MSRRRDTSTHVNVFRPWNVWCSVMPQSGVVSPVVLTQRLDLLWVGGVGGCGSRGARCIFEEGVEEGEWRRSWGEEERGGGEVGRGRGEGVAGDSSSSSDESLSAGGGGRRGWLEAEEGVGRGERDRGDDCTSHVLSLTRRDIARRDVVSQPPVRRHLMWLIQRQPSLQIDILCLHNSKMPHICR